MIAWKYGAGSALKMSLEVTEAEHRAFFSVRDWNAIVRSGLYQAGKEWVDIRLPLRFTDFARQLGYNAKVARGNSSKQPLVQYGRLRAFLLSHAYPEARVTSKNIQLILRLPVPSMLNHSKHGVTDSGILYTANRIVNNTIQTITKDELEAIAESVVQTMTAMISGSGTTVNRRGVTKKSLSVEQRVSVAHTVKPQGSIHSHVIRK